MGGVNGRLKGARGEREWARVLRERLGCGQARRAAQIGVEGGRDVELGLPGTHAEVKRVEALRAAGAVRALEQAEEAAQPGELPYVAHRRNRQPWQVTCRAGDLHGLLAAVREACAESGQDLSLEPAAPVTLELDTLLALAGVVRPSGQVASDKGRK